MNDGGRDSIPFGSSVNLVLETEAFKGNISFFSASVVYILQTGVGLNHGRKVSLLLHNFVLHQNITFFVFCLHSIAYLNADEVYFVILFVEHIEKEYLFCRKKYIKGQGAGHRGGTAPYKTLMNSPSG